MKPSTPSQQKVSRSIILATVAIFASVTVLFLLFRSDDSSKNTANANQSANADANTNSSSPVSETKTYESTRLGVRFKYLSQDLGRNILVKEEGDTVYVYSDGTPLEQGQFVRVFKKRPDQTLQQAIESQFLKGYDRTQCFVAPGIDGIGDKPSSGVAAVISFPVSDTDSPWWINSEKCPKGYSLTNGLSYFWTDQENSDKFVFFSIGQYIIPSSATYDSWHTTIELIE